jgi:hypothetical protein
LTTLAILLVLTGIGPALFLVLWISSRNSRAVRYRLRDLYAALPDRVRNRIEQISVLEWIRRTLLQV